MWCNAGKLIRRGSGECHARAGEVVSRLCSGCTGEKGGRVVRLLAEQPPDHAHHGHN